MTLFVRKIERAKWEQRKITEGEDVSADAITNSLKTTNNALSIWEISDFEELEEAILAIVSVFDKPNTIDVVLLKKDALIKAGLRIVKSDGITNFQKFIEHHYDVVDLTYKTLGTFAYLIVDCFREEKVYRYTSPKIKNLITNVYYLIDVLTDPSKFPKP